MNLKQAAVGAAALDAASIALFAAIGRASHDEGVLGERGLGYLTTVWPFLAGAALGWLLSRAWTRPCAFRPTGLIVWGAAVVGGMLLRLASGQGVQLSFVIVAAIFLGLTLVGWRVVSGAIARRRGLTP